MAKKETQIAVIGAGWAGCAAAVELSKRGHTVTLIEASRTLGGRARTVSLHGKQLDNGQHIMLGAYSGCLELMRTLQIDVNQALLRLPLQMVYPKQTGMQFIAPTLPAPLHLLVALFSAKGLDLADKMALARFSTTARWMDWQLDHDCSVIELMARFDQTEKLCRLMWYPLCIAALNTPPERASARVFLHVLRDSLGARRAASDMLIPRHDLSRLLPDAAAAYITARQGQVVCGLSITDLTLLDNQKWQLPELDIHQSDNTEFDHIILATNAEQCKRLLTTITFNSTRSVPSITTKIEFDYEPITTCYLQYAESVRLDRAFFALVDQPEKNYWGQFIFDRGQLNNEQAGLMAVVVSASAKAIELTHEQLALAIAQQLASEFNLADLAQPIWTKLITEKRATFSCSPHLHRPANDTGIDNLLIAGDFTAGDYPATLEAAVRSGLSAARLVP